MNRQQSRTMLNTALEVIGSRGLSGMRVTASTLPEALEAIGALDHVGSTAERRAIVANLRRLELIEVTKSGDQITVQPSVKAVHRLQRAALDGLFVQPQTKWDNTWRMVSYDIPARYSKQRRLFVSQLHRLGFTMLKDSMWFHPYPCFDTLSELISYCGLTQFVMVAEIIRLDESSIRKLHKAYPALSR